MNKIYLEIGGNEGDRLNNIECVKKEISKHVGEIVNESAVYESPAWGFESDLSFYNQVLEVQTSLNANELLKQNLEIEKKMGRVRGINRYSSRTMDVDILFYNEEHIESEKLTVPHPRLHLRNFVLVPLNEIASNLLHPVFKKTIGKLLIECDDDSECSKIVV